MSMRFLSLICALFFAGYSHAATILVEPLGPNKPVLVSVTGQLNPTDGQQFSMKVAPLSKAIVSFQSDGGSVVAGIQIGEAIRLKGFASFVPDDARCASACALAWLGGAPRFMGQRAQIGFHAAYNAESGQETGVGNAIVGAYLSRIGLAYSAVIYITQAAPNSMTWLTISDANQIGIDVTLLQSLQRSPPDQQISNAQTEPSGSHLEDLTNRSTIFLKEIFREWSMPNDYVARQLEGLYADQATYYGHLQTKQQILVDKLKFIKRWPDRKYTLRPDTLTVRCNQEPDVCTLKGVVDWQVHNPERSASSSGEAQFFYILAFQGISIKITEERSSVISRNGVHINNHSKEKEREAALRKDGWTQQQIDNMSPDVRARKLKEIEEREKTTRPKQFEPPSLPRQQDVWAVWWKGFSGMVLWDYLKNFWWVGLLIGGGLFNSWNKNRSKNKAHREEFAQKEQNRRAEAEREQKARQEHERREQQRQEQKRSEQTAQNKKTDGPQWWEVLGVSQNASMDQIKQAYHDKLRMYHPDRVNGLGPEFIRMAEDQTRKLNSAFEQARRNNT